MYKKPRRMGFRARLRRDLRQAMASERAEQRSSAKDIERGVRARLQEQVPGLTPDEIEAAVARITADRSPSKVAAPPKPAGIPADVQAARRAARKGQLKAMRSRRRTS